MTFNCDACDTIYEELDDMKEIQVTDGLRNYTCSNCDSDTTLAKLEYPTD